MLIFFTPRNPKKIYTLMMCAIFLEPAVAKANKEDFFHILNDITI